MKSFILILFLMFSIVGLAGCSDGGDTSEGAGETNVLVNGDGNEISFIDANPSAEGASVNINGDGNEDTDDESDIPVRADCSEESQEAGVCQLPDEGGG